MVTANEIRRCELAYRLNRHLSMKRISLNEFSEEVSIPLGKLESIVQDSEATVKYSDLLCLCDALSISLDSIIYGPTNEPLFAELVNKCVVAEKIPFKWLLQIYTLYLRRWRKRNISDDLLLRYNLWSEFLTTPESEYVWQRIASRKTTAYQDGFKAYKKVSMAVPSPGYTDEESPEAIERAKGHIAPKEK